MFLFKNIAVYRSKNAKTVTPLFPPQYNLTTKQRLYRVKHVREHTYILCKFSWEQFCTRKGLTNSDPSHYVRQNVNLFNSSAKIEGGKLKVFLFFLKTIVVYRSNNVSKQRLCSLHKRRYRMKHVKYTRHTHELCNFCPE